MIEARVGDLQDPTKVHYYVMWNTGGRTLVPSTAIHDQRMSIYGYILMPVKR